MMTRVALLSLFALMIMTVPTHAYAQADNNTSSGVCDGTMDPDECMWSPIGTESGTYYSCNAKGTWGGTCIDFVKLTNGFSGCLRTQKQAHCTCDADRKTTTGLCFYEP
jgi:hypothetical protein